jgi:O-antigen ligase
MLLRVRWRLAILPPLGLIATALVLTYSRGSWMAAVVGLLVVLALAAWRERTRVLMFGVAIGAIVLVALNLPGGAESLQRLEQLGLDYLLHDSGIVARFAWWDESFGLFWRSPVFGNGLDAYVAINPWGAHNHWLELLSGVGLAGTLPQLAVIAISVTSALRALRTPGLHPTLATILVAAIAAGVSFAAWSVAESVHSDRRIIGFFWAALGMGIGAAARVSEVATKSRG